MSDSKSPLDTLRCIISLIHNGPRRRVLDPLLVLWTADKQEMRFPSRCALFCKLTTAVWDHSTQTLNLCTTFFLQILLKSCAIPPLPTPVWVFLHTKHFGTSSVGPPPSIVLYIVPVRAVNVLSPAASRHYPATYIPL